MACRIVDHACKTAGETKPWTFDYGLRFLTRFWQPGKRFAAGVAVRPRTPTGFQYVSSGGYSGSREPKWPTVAGDDVEEGSITWTAEAIDNDSLVATIVSSSWSAPAGITVGGASFVNTDGDQTASAQVSGGTVDTTYEIKNTVTLNTGAVEESVVEFTIS